MKRFIITEEEKKRIRLLYEETSQFVNTINSLLKVNPQDSTRPYDALDWSTKTDETEKQNLANKFNDVKNEFSAFTNKAFNEKKDLTQIITTLENLQSGTREQIAWKNAALEQLKKIKNAVSNPSSNNNSQDQNNNSQDQSNNSQDQNNNSSQYDWKNKIQQTFGYTQ